jgi:tryptophanyl-tRNA synthetase
MSKSDASDYSRIMLNDSVDQINQKIKKAKTDSLPLPTNLKEASQRPEALNLLSIFAALKGRSSNEIIQMYAGKEFSVLKKELADLVVENIAPIATEMKKLMNDEIYLDNVMAMGKNKAIAIADPILNKVYDVVGLAKVYNPQKN